VQTTDAQVRKLMEEMSKHGLIGRAARKADMDRKTAGKYVRLGKLPSELKAPRTWRTRANPFEADWPWIEERLAVAPELEAKALFEALQERRPGQYPDGGVRTLQRHVKQWRALHGPDKEVFFSQQHRAGEAVQVDFTSANVLGVTIGRVLFAHLLCHVVLPHSNWQWVTVCLSESLLALKRGVQEALFRLGRRPEWLQTDNTSAATHRPTGGKREFNAEYRCFVEALGMKPRTTEIGAKEQNGDVEAANGALKRSLKQHLELRGSHDFDSVEAYEAWLGDICVRRNARRAEKVSAELASMVPMSTARLAEFHELDVPVTSWSTIRVLYNAYSVPSRLIGEWVRVRVYERTLEVWYADKQQLEIERLRGRHGHRIDYRHIIWSLVQKPGAFARYRYREELFPSLAFRRAYDAIFAEKPSLRGDLEYLRILHWAAATMESDVEAALECLLDDGQVPTAETVRDLMGGVTQSGPPMLDAYTVELGDYDALLGPKEVAS
jgi:hypothetical protein